MVLTPTALRFRGRNFPCTIGRGGVKTNKREGDGATPAGIHCITGLLFRPDRMAPPAPWAVAIGKDDLWSDASDDADYNQWIRAPYHPSHERLKRADPLYDIVLLTDWNWPESTAGMGSAIFLHQYRRPGYPTEGCIAFRRDHLHWIAARAAPGTRVIVRPQP